MGERRHLGLELSILLPQPSDFCVTGICHHIQFYFLFLKTFMDSCQTRNPSYIHSEPCVFCKISDTYFSIDLCVMRLFQEVEFHFLPPLLFITTTFLHSSSVIP